MPPLDLTDADHLKQVVVDPLIAALRAEMRDALRPLVEQIASLALSDGRHERRIEQIEQRLSGIERFKMKIAGVCSGIAVIAGIGWRMALDWIRSHLPRLH
jgi:hypothetical protein